LTDYYTDANKKNPLTILTTLVASLSLSSIFSFISNHPKYNINNPKALGHQIKLLSSDFAREFMTYSCEKEEILRKQYFAHRSPPSGTYICTAPSLHKATQVF